MGKSIKLNNNNYWDASGVLVSVNGTTPTSLADVSPVDTFNAQSHHAMSGVALQQAIDSNFIQGSATVNGNYNLVNADVTISKDDEDIVVNVNKSLSITPSITTPGWIGSGSGQGAVAGTYIIGSTDVSVAATSIEPNLVSENIRSGVSIFGVEGTSSSVRAGSYNYGEVLNLNTFNNLKQSYNTAIIKSSEQAPVTKDLEIYVKLGGNTWTKFHSEELSLPFVDNNPVFSIYLANLRFVRNEGTYTDIIISSRNKIGSSDSYTKVFSNILIGSDVGEATDIGIKIIGSGQYDYFIPEQTWK